jgi:hypothetical protein
MKKLVILIIALTTVLSFSANAQFQTSVTIGNEVGPVGTSVYVPVEVNFSNVGAFDFYIDLPTDLNFVNVANSVVPVSQSIIGSQILVSWAGITPISINNGKLLDLVFSSNVEGIYDLDFYNIPGSPIPAGSSVVSDAQGNQITPTIWNDGTVEFVPSVPLKNWAIFIGLGLIIAFLVVRFRRIV